MNEKKVRKALRELEILLQDSGTRTREFKAAALLKQALAPAPRFYVGQPVLVGNDNEHWDKAYFHGIMMGEYRAGYSRTFVDAYSFKYCNPDPDAVSLPNWVEHDGESVIIDPPEKSVLVWETNKGDVGHSTGQQCIHYEVARYCIIPLPQWID